MRSSDWVSWGLGAAVLAAVIVAALHLSEGREFAHLLEQAKPGWLVVAVVLQAGTYFAQAEVFGGAPRSAGIVLPKSWLYELSLTKLFVDQALPSAGISSTVVVAKALQQRGVARQTAAACAVINIASYHAAYVLTLLLALAITSVLRETNAYLVLVSVLFMAFALALTAGILAMVGRRAGTGTKWHRLPVISGLVSFLDDADATIVRNAGVFGAAMFWQIAIFVLDAATMWVCVRSLGTTAPADAVFASFMISSLVRTIGIVPGGLGTYEATSVLTLRVVGLSFSVALSATLIFRGLSFWIPMLPGLWASRRVMRSRDSPFVA